MMIKMRTMIAAAVAMVVFGAVALMNYSNEMIYEAGLAVALVGATILVMGAVHSSYRRKNGDETRVARKIRLPRGYGYYVR